MDNIQKFEDFLDRLQGLLDNAKKQGHIIVRVEDLENAFPELKESEEEVVRKEIIAFLKENHETGRADETWSLSGIERWIAWLEKQGQKPQCKSIIEAWKDMRLEVYQQASGNRHEPNYSDDTTKMFSLNDIDEIIEKINEQTEKQGEQKPAWSEEDDDALGQAIFALEDLVDDSEPNTCYAGYHLPFKEAIKRLKSLKQRML